MSFTGSYTEVEPNFFFLSEHGEKGIAGHNDTCSVVWPRYGLSSTNQIARLAAIVVKKNYCISTEVLYIIVIGCFPFFISEECNSQRVAYFLKNQGGLTH